MTQNNKVANDAAVVWLKWALGVSVLLLVLKVVNVGGEPLSDVAAWSWWWVFSPLWGLFGLAASIAALQVWGNKRRLKKAQESENATLLRMARKGAN